MTYKNADRNSISGIGSLTTGLWAGGMVLLLAMIAATSAQGQTYKVLYNFGQNSPDGGGPYATLSHDSTGNLYGTTYGGGPYGGGTVFKLDTSGNESIVYAFGAYTGDGSTPYGGVVRDTAGNLYGTTSAGGTYNDGLVFKITPTGQQIVLHEFTGGSDGGEPRAGVILAGGSVYGTTSQGGTSKLGTVFKINGKTGKEIVLHSFTGGVDGAGPEANPSRDSSGNLYGTTVSGGGSCSCGVVYKIDAVGNYSILHSFVGYPTDGDSPGGALLRDAAGNLYGTTTYGGSGSAGTSRGTVFKVDPSNNETMLYSFTCLADGCTPQCNLVRDGAGNLYGTGTNGGVNQHGVVFKVDPAGNETTLHSFPDAPGDGAVPAAGLVRDSAGNLYGVAYGGGEFGYGNVFKLKP